MGTQREYQVQTYQTLLYFYGVTLSHFPRNHCDKSHKDLCTRKLIRGLVFSAFISELVTKAFFCWCVPFSVYQNSTLPEVSITFVKGGNCDTHTHTLFSQTSLVQLSHYQLGNSVYSPMSDKIPHWKQTCLVVLNPSY